MVSSQPLVWTVAPRCEAGTCVAVALTAEGDVAVGDTKAPDRQPHTFTPAEWDVFVEAVKGGTFDRVALPRPAAATV